MKFVSRCIFLGVTKTKLTNKKVIMKKVTIIKSASKIFAGFDGNKEAAVK